MVSASWLEVRKPDHDKNNCSMPRTSFVVPAEVWIDRNLAGVRLASNAQFLLRLFADHAGIPGRLPDQINSGIADTFQSKNPLPGIRSNHRSHATSRCSQRHFHGYVITLVDLHIINQTQVDNVNWDFRIVAFVEMPRRLVL